MATIILGQHADALTVRLTEGDGADLVATLVDSTGAEVDWPAAPTLSFAHTVTRDVIADHVAIIAGPIATWDLTRTDVDDIAAGSLPKRAGQLLTYALITTPATGDADGHVEYAGKVDWRDGWTAGDRSQRVTFTLPGVPGPAGPPGSGGSGSDVLTIVNGGTISLDDTKPEGTIVGYRVKATATFEGEGGTADLEPGAYTFERTDTGWTYYTATGTVFGGVIVPPSGWTTIATDTFTANNGTAIKNRSTTTGSLTWTDADGTSPDVTVQGNRASFTGSSYGNRFRIPLGATHDAGVRVTFDYELFGVNPNSGTIAVGATVQWSPHASGVSLNQTGALGVFGDVQPTGLTGALSGLPASGTMQIEWLSADLKVLINGSQVATAMLSNSPLKGDAIDVSFNSNAVAIDNLLIEVKQ